MSKRIDWTVERLKRNEAYVGLSVSRGESETTLQLALGRRVLWVSFGRR